jgi:selenocysteine lyase/cysteine desulfurase
MTKDLSRRSFLRGLCGGSAAVGVAAGPLAGRAEASLAAVARAAEAPSESEYWARIRDEFLVTDQVAYMNNGTLGPTPKPVYYTVVERYRELAADPGARNPIQEQTAEEVRRKAAAFVGASPDEIALLRNTTEAMGFIASGLELAAGDEVLLSFHEHPGGIEPWRLKAKRHGVVLREVQFPIPTPDPAIILELFADAITPRTRVISVSHLTYQTGSGMPVKELAQLARSKGILSVIDGAHPLGMMRLDLHDIGADFYAMSPHKWLDAPTGTGLLYIRRESQERLWPTVVTSTIPYPEGGADWSNPDKGAARFDRFSQRAWPLVLATGAAIDFQDAIGRERIESRVRSLAALLRTRLQEIPGVRIYTPAHPALACGLVGFTFERFKNTDVMETLLRRNHVRVRTTEYGLNTVRASTHYYNTEEQVERLAEGLRDIPRRGVLKSAAPAAGDD